MLVVEIVIKNCTDKLSPLSLLTVIVYSVRSCEVVGVPLIFPVLGSKLRPSGSVGVMAKLLTFVYSGVFVVSAPVVREISVLG